MKKIFIVLVIGFALCTKPCIVFSVQEYGENNEVKTLIKNGVEVEFKDSKGRTIKKISLQPEMKIISRTRKVGNKKETNKIKQEINKHAVNSENGSHTLIIIDKRDRYYIDENNKEQQINEGYVTGGVILFDSEGKILFEKEFPLGIGIGTTRRNISANGDVVAVKTFDTTGDVNKPREIIYVFDKKGQTIITIPSVK